MAAAVAEEILEESDAAASNDNSTRLIKKGEATMPLPFFILIVYFFDESSLRSVEIFHNWPFLLACD